MVFMRGGKYKHLRSAGPLELAEGVPWECEGVTAILLPAVLGPQLVVGYRASVLTPEITSYYLPQSFSFFQTKISQEICQTRISQEICCSNLFLSDKDFAGDLSNKDFARDCCFF